MSTKLWIGDKLYLVDEDVDDYITKLVEINGQFQDEIERLKKTPKPDEKPPIVRLMTTVDGREKLYFRAEEDEARKSLAACKEGGCEVDGPRLVEIRFAEAKDA